MVLVRAPVRMSFGGGGTDLAAYYARFGGLVVSTAITRYSYVMAGAPVDGSIRISSADYHIWEVCRPRQLPPVGEPLALPKAALDAFVDRGIRETGVDLFLASEVPPGSGLGSSSAMAVALSQALAVYTGGPMAAARVAETACHLEIERLGMPIGKQDQYASAYGGLNTIEFTAAGVRVTPLDLPADTIAALSARLMLFSTGQTRDSARILSQQRRDTASNPLVIESLHEIKRLALRMREALVAEQLDDFGRLLDAAWQHKKRLSGKVSSSVIDGWYKTAREAGALGGKITGAGGGGFFLLYSPKRRVRSVRAAMAAAGLRELPFELDFSGVTTLANTARSTEPATSWNLAAPSRQLCAGTTYATPHDIQFPSILDSTEGDYV